MALNIRRSATAAINVLYRLHSLPKNPIATRGISTSAIMSKEQMDELKTNPYFDKYADKIAKLQKTSPEEFLSRLAEAEEEKKKASQKFGGGPKVEEKEFSLPTHPKAGLSGSSKFSKEKKLDEKMKLDLLKDKSKEEISNIWREYHSTKDCVSAVIPADIYKQMQARFAEHSTFLFPLPRKQGYEFVVVQFDGNQAHFTTLINYQAHKENAPECLTLVHYTDLCESKGVVLMVGEYDTNVMTIQESQCLANQVEMYYASPSEEQRRLLETFTRRPAEFKHADLLAQMDAAALLQK